MDNFSIVANKDLADIDLLLREQPSLPEAMRQLNLCDTFVGVLGGQTVAVCLLARRKNYFEIVNLAVASIPEESEVTYQMLMYVMDYVRVQGGSYIEIGVGDGDFRRHALLIRMRFRVVGVWRDYFARSKHAEQGNRPAHRDMLRYRIDLNELQPQ